ncbi:hypothetical protein PROFUN_04001 [Planoprotostelium fungivorum]|uniref:Major facilitator superfamily (MFS) profile domain-containing protein n=1 Tax=Planoprotostelium fungivorum TaxID=1890364 RepID=A0A2P6NWC4_9EUKA|nr:hypothetical protein PROFUN_04001 [Planoprotostelium fungivorum]
MPSKYAKLNTAEEEKGEKRSDCVAEGGSLIEDDVATFLSIELFLIELSDEDQPIQVITAGPKHSDEKPPPKDEGFPRVQLLMAYLLVVGDSIALSISIPFIPEMCEKRFGVSEEMVGVVSGVINGSYSFAMFLSSFALGHISDEFGRRPVLLFGSLIGFITTLFFGLSTTVWFALATRIIGGLTNSSVAVTKAVIADVTADKPQYRVVAYGYHGAAFSAARALCGALAGLTSGIILTRDESIPFISNNPYILPCITGSAVLFVSFIAAIFLLPETNKRARPFCSSSGEKSQKAARGGMKEGMKTIWKDPLLRKLNIMYCINSFANGGILTALPLYWSLSSGIAFSIFGAAAVVFQMGLFPYIMRRAGSKAAYLTSSILFVISSLMWPFNSIFYTSAGVTTFTTVITWIYLSVTCILSAVAFMMGLPLVSSMISNVSDPRRQGLVIGTAQSISSFLRSIGPVASGAIFSFSVVIKVPFLLFAFLAVQYLACGLIMFFISSDDADRIDRPPMRVDELEMDEQAGTIPQQIVVDDMRREVQGLLKETEGDDAEDSPAVLVVSPEAQHPIVIDVFASPEEIGIFEAEPRIVLRDKGIRIVEGQPKTVHIGANMQIRELSCIRIRSCSRSSTSGTKQKYKVVYFTVTKYSILFPSQ